MGLAFSSLSIQFSIEASFLSLLLLFTLSLCSGIITAAIGPGGVLLIAGLHVFTPLSPAEVAGTSSGTFFIGSILGASKFAQSGEINYRLSGVLSLASVVGVQFGVGVNRFVSETMFNTILAGILGVAGLVVIYKQYNKLTSAYALSVYSLSGIVVVTLLGLVVGTTGGLTGIGGPALSVPALLILRVPIIQAVSAGIVQSVFMTASTGIRYALTGDIGLILLFTLATPFAVGILIGYRIAHKLDTNILRISLGVFLIIVSGIIALG